MSRKLQLMAAMMRMDATPPEPPIVGTELYSFPGAGDDLSGCLVLTPNPSQQYTLADGYVNIEVNQYDTSLLGSSAKTCSVIPTGRTTTGYPVRHSQYSGVDATHIKTNDTYALPSSVNFSAFKLALRNTVDGFNLKQWLADNNLTSATLRMVGTGYFWRMPYFYIQGYQGLQLTDESSINSTLVNKPAGFVGSFDATFTLDKSAKTLAPLSIKMSGGYCNGGNYVEVKDAEPSLVTQSANANWDNSVILKIPTLSAESTIKIYHITE